MASNFHLFQNPNRDSIHIHMRGDFDGTSAYELINALKNLNGDYYTVLIDTDELNLIHDFGIDVFQRNLLGANNSRNIIFIGRNKHRFSA